MLTPATDTNNDLFIDVRGHLALHTGQAALAATAEQAMKTLRGEMIFARGRGLPYFEALWTGTPDLQRFEDTARETLTGLNGVTDVRALTTRVQDGALVYTATLETIYGDVALGGAKE